MTESGAAVRRRPPPPTAAPPQTWTDEDLRCVRQFAEAWLAWYERDPKIPMSDVPDIRYPYLAPAAVGGS